MGKEYKDQFGDRMKTYEAAYDYYITKRLPVIIRLDGRAFHNVTKKMPKPCYTFGKVMAHSMMAVAADIEGCVFGYTQSDEVTLVLKNDQSLQSQAWFDNRLQKMITIAASSMTYWFNNGWEHRDFYPDHQEESEIDSLYDFKLPTAVFDARVFAVPSMIEMVNAVIWRQKDCLKNAISLAAYEELSKKHGKGHARKMLDKQGQADRLELLKKECSIEFHQHYPSAFRKGYGAYKKDKLVTGPSGEQVMRSVWKLDSDLPIFSKDNSLLVKCYDFTTDEEDKEEAAKKIKHDK
jgi:tRNA(His) 5'-end guanylyltransferase